MGKKKTHEEYVAELAIKNPNIEVVDQYIDTHTKILHHCIQHDITWMIAPAHILQGQGCPSCKIDKIGNTHRKSHEQYVNELLAVNDQVVVKEQYKDSKTPILHHCNIHNIDWMIAPQCALNGHKCPMCSGGVLKTHEQYVIDVTNINPDIEVKGKYINSSTPILHMCKLCGHMWNARPYNILSGKGCPMCRESVGEKYIRKWLDLHFINFVYQKTFDDCKDINVLPFDFYLPEYNICIEYNGQQHYEAIDFAGRGKKWAEEKLTLTQYHDMLKYDYCAKNNIRLIIIPYWADVNVELNKFLLI